MWMVDCFNPLVSQCGKPTLNRHSVYIGEDVIANVGVRWIANVVRWREYVDFSNSPFLNW